MNALAKTRYTDRLCLEPINENMADKLWELFQDEGIAEWYGGKWTRGKALSESSKMGEAWKRSGGAHKWLATDKATGELIGRGGLSVVKIDGRNEIEIGWALRQKFWGQGYATEMGGAGLELAFSELGADYVVAFTEPHNTRSRAVMERLGFTYIKDFHKDGELFALYRLTKAEYEKRAYASS
jgi:RimJ/RimL family protein N-acetyltransferase